MGVNINSNLFRYAGRGSIHRLRLSLNGLEHSMPVVASRAISRTVDHVATVMVKEVTKVYSIKSKDVRATLYKKKPGKTNAYAYITSKGKTLSLGQFPHSPKKYSSKPKVVKVKIKKREGFKEIHTSPTAFVQKIYGSDHDVYQRKGFSKMPVIKLKSLSIPQMIDNEKVMDRIQEAAQTKLNQRLEHEYNRAVQRAQRVLG